MIRLLFLMVLAGFVAAPAMAFSSRDADFSWAPRCELNAFDFDLDGAERDWFAAGRLLSYQTGAAPVVSTPAVPAKPDPAPVLEQLRKRYGKSGGLEARFREQAKSSIWGDGPERQVLVQVQLPGRFRWEYLEENGDLYVADGVNFWLAQPANKVVSKSLYDPAILQRMLGFLTGLDSLSKDFTVERLPDEGTNRVLRLIPLRPSELGAALIDMYVDAKTGALQRVQLKDDDGSLTVLRIDSLQAGVTVPAERFLFVVPQGWSVMSM